MSRHIESTFVTIQLLGGFTDCLHLVVVVVEQTKTIQNVSGGYFKYVVELLRKLTQLP